jgi:NAD-dependent deacetylase
LQVNNVKVKMKKLVVLTGAGMSVESGFSTFRGADGLWEKVPVEDIATPEGWKRNPTLVLDFYNQLRKKLIDAKPNAGHLALAKMEKYFNVQIITQNIDNLHERAGSTSVIHLHGELMKVRSTGGKEEVFEVDPINPDVNSGDKCPKGFQLRPHIVWFGEAVPEIENAIRFTEKAAIFLVIGTSLNVYPAAGLLSYVPRGVPIYLIDPNEVNVYHPNVTVIQKGASEGLQEFIKMMKMED